MASKNGYVDHELLFKTIFQSISLKQRFDNLEKKGNFVLHVHINMANVSICEYRPTLYQ